MATKKNTTVVIDGKEYEYFRITRTIGHEYKHGKKVPIKKQFVGTSKGNAEAKYKEFLQDQAEAKYAAEQEKAAQDLKLFREYAEEYTYEVLPVSAYGHGTKEQYERSYRVHIKNTWITTMVMKDIKAKDIQDFYEQLDVSKQTLESIHKWMSAFYKWIVIKDYGSNILSAITLPKKRDSSKGKDIVVWEQDEIQKIFAKAEEEKHRLLFLFKVLFYSGLRISEALGLKYSDITNGQIHVERQYERGVLCPPKHNSYRTLPAHTELLRALEDHILWHKEEMRKNKYKGDYIFTTSTGKLLDYHNVRRSMERLYKRCDIAPKKIHAYRSTFCTELCRAKVPIEVASKLMGHKSVEVTAKHYALIREDTKAEAISMLPTF